MILSCIEAEHISFNELDVPTRCNQAKEVLDYDRISFSREMCQTVALVHQVVLTLVFFGLVV